MIFSEDELAARRQFHEIFCTKYLYTGSKNGALNDASWDSQVISEILHGVYENNPLVPADIETMLQIGGMYDSNNELYFHLHTGTPLLKSLVYAISPFITTAAYIKCQQVLNGRESDSVGEFLTRYCANNSVAPLKILSGDLYELYKTWCRVYRYIDLSKRTFNRRLGILGYVQHKGYANKCAGVGYYIITLDKEALNKDVQSRIEAKQEEDRRHIDALRDDAGSGEEISPEFTEGEACGIPETEGEQILAADYAGNLEMHGGDDPINEESGEQPAEDVDRTFGNEDLAGIFGDDADDFDWGNDADEDDDAEGGYEPSATADSQGAGAPVGISDGNPRDLVARLDTPIRQYFKLAKVTYRIAPMHFDRAEFERDLKASAGSLNASQMEEMYQLFLAYAGEGVNSNED